MPPTLVIESPWRQSSSLRTRKRRPRQNWKASSKRPRVRFGQSQSRRRNRGPFCNPAGPILNGRFARHPRETYLLWFCWATSHGPKSRSLQLMTVVHRTGLFVFPSGHSQSPPCRGRRSRSGDAEPTWASAPGDLPPERRCRFPESPSNHASAKPLISSWTAE